MKTGALLVGLTALFCFALLAACSGPQYVHARCGEDYDECINACAYQCEEGGAEVGPAYSTETSTFNTWDAACQRCTDQCSHVADRCEERHDEEVFAD